MMQTSNTFKITIYANNGAANNRHQIPINNNITLEQFLRLCSSKLKIEARRAFHQNGEEVLDIESIIKDEQICITEGDDININVEFTINSIILGPASVGKSSIIIRYVHQNFSDHYIPTVEALFNKTVKYGTDTYDLSIVDTSGTEEWATLQFEYMSNKDAVILVYSIERRENIEAVEKIYHELRHYHRDIPVILVANKIDIHRRIITKAEGQALADKFGCPYLEVSAKKNININEIFIELIKIKAKKKNTTAETCPKESFSEDDDEHILPKKSEPENNKGGCVKWLLNKCCFM